MVTVKFYPRTKLLDFQRIKFLAKRLESSFLARQPRRVETLDFGLSREHRSEHVIRHMEGQKKITREELYERVWKTPFVRLAKELGYCYADLVAICADLSIPRPSGGYWYRLQHGGASEQLPLPVNAPGKPTDLPLGAKLNQPPVKDKGAAQPDGPTPSAEATRADAESTTTNTDLKADGQVDQAPEKTYPIPVFPDFVVLGREQLYQHVWTTPCQQLAKALGVSDVALAKTCDHMGIPRPARGYWARIEAGEKVEKTALPPARPGQVQTWRFDVANNRARRQQWALHNLSTAGKGNPAIRLELRKDVQFHPIAQRHHDALQKAKPDEKGVLRLKRNDLFDCQVSLGLIPKLVAAIDAICNEFARREYKFPKGANEYRGLRIANGEDEIGLRWQEAVIEVEREPTVLEKRKPSWTWQLKEWKATGWLQIEVSAIGLKGPRKLTESEDKPIGDILGRVVEKVTATFKAFEERRQRETEREKLRAEEAQRLTQQRAREAELEAQREKERKERERVLRHEQKLAQIAAARRNNLGVAADQWVESKRIQAFVKACEMRWREASGGELTEEQLRWLDWALSAAIDTEPWKKGYPDPTTDGAFDMKAIPLGGPYPETKSLESPEIAATDETPQKPTSAPHQHQPTQVQSWPPYSRY